MFDDPKSRYLFAFEKVFTDLCGGHRVAARWNQGMWCNAHMYHGMKVPAQEAAKRFFDDIMKYPSNQAALASLRAANHKETIS